jgi:hypothetical protein
MKWTFGLLLAALLTAVMFLPSGCSCGFDCSGSNNSDNNNGSDSALLTLGFSDSLPEDLKQAVIKVETITFRSSGVDDVKVNNFTISELNLTNAPSFQVNLLDYPGTKQLSVITNIKLEPALYDVFIDVAGGSLDNSFIQLKSDDSMAQLNVEGNRLVLPNLRLDAGSQTVTVEFDLARSLRFVDTSNDYQLSENGIRMVNNTNAAQLSGEVDRALFDTIPPCDAKVDPLAGNRVYLYPGGDLSSSLLVDVYRATTTADSPPAGSIAPLTVASLAVNASNAWEYTLGYLPPGTYTLAFACDTAGDDSVQWDDLVIPLPDNMKYRIVLSAGQVARCDLSADTSRNPGDCSRQ